MASLGTGASRRLASVLIGRLRYTDALIGCSRTLVTQAVCKHSHQSFTGQQCGNDQRGFGGLGVAAAAGAAAASALCWPSQSECSAPPPASPFQAASAQPTQGWGGLPGWLARWLPGGWGRGSGGQYLQAIRDDPRVAVVLAFALPFLALSFGTQPSQADMDRAAALIEPHVDSLRPWEVSVLLWGAARLGYEPRPALLRAFRARVAATLRQPPGTLRAFSPQEACMAAWALSVVGGQDAELWALEVAFAAACPPDAMDEVALIHLWQAALFTERSAVTALGSGPAHSPGSVPPRLRSATDEVRATLAAAGCPPQLISRCEAAYRSAARQPGFDGPYLTELTMLRLLVTIHQELGDSAAFVPLLEELRLMDVQRAKQLLSDPYLLSKFRSEIAERHSRRNSFTRALADVSRALRELGVRHVVQAPVEDGLVHVDVALPDFRIAFFLEAAPLRGPAQPGGPHLLNLDPEGAVLAGYAANETLGTKRAKQRVLQQHGWVVLPLAWSDSTRGDAERRQLLLQQIDKAGKQQLMRGRVSAMVQAAIQTAQESKLGGERYGNRGSAGQYLTRSVPSQSGAN